MPPTRKPNFFLVGAPKSGTSSLYHHIRQHPDIFMPDNKEPFHFGDGPRSGAEWVVRDRDEYLALFAPATSEKMVGEGSTCYLYSDSAARELKDFSPEAKIIIMLREPVSLMHAMHWHNVRFIQERVKDFGRALALEGERAQGRSLPKEAHFAPGLLYRRIVDFQRHIQRFHDTFGPERVHVIIFDDFKKDSMSVVQQVFRFLGVDDSFKPELKLQNKAGPLTLAPARRFLKEHPTLHAAARLIPPGLRTTIAETLGGAVGAKEDRPPIDPELREQLRTEYAPQIESLESYLGVDLSAWKA